VREVITPLSTAQTESVHSRVRINTRCAGQVDLDASGSGILHTALGVLSIAVWFVRMHFIEVLYQSCFTKSPRHGSCECLTGQIGHLHPSSRNNSVVGVGSPRDNTTEDIFFHTSRVILRGWEPVKGE